MLTMEPRRNGVAPMASMGSMTPNVRESVLVSRNWSWTFGMIDPNRFPAGPSVGARWDSGGLGLYRNAPGDAYASGRLRSSR